MKMALLHASKCKRLIEEATPKEQPAELTKEEICEKAKHIHFPDDMFEPVPQIFKCTHRPLRVRKAEWPEGTRQCNACCKIKPLDEFNVHHGGLFNRKSICKDCQNEVSRIRSRNYRKKLKLIKEMQNE